LGWIKKMLKKGIGIAFLQRMVVMDELKSGTLVELPLIKPLPPTPVYLVSHTNFPVDIRESACQIAQMLFKQSL
jgi:DNA-binding transcriptional LysR family regulator